MIKNISEENTGIVSRIHALFLWVFSWLFPQETPSDDNDNEYLVCVWVFMSICVDASLYAHKNIIFLCWHSNWKQLEYRPEPILICGFWIWRHSNIRAHKIAGLDLSGGHLLNHNMEHQFARLTCCSRRPAPFPSWQQAAFQSVSEDVAGNISDAYVSCFVPRSRHTRKNVPYWLANTLVLCCQR